MTEDLAQQTADAMKQVAPWRKDVAWWVVLLQGLVSLGLGLYVLFAETSTVGGQLVGLLGIWLLVEGVLRIISSMRGKYNPTMVPYRMLGGGIALVIGLLILLNIWAPTPFLTVQVAAGIIALGLVLVGAVNMLEWFMARRALGAGIMSLIMPAAMILIGLVFLVSGFQSSATVINALGWIMTIAGAGLLIYSFILRGRQTAAEAQPATAPAAASAPAAAPAAPPPAAPPAASPPTAPSTDKPAA
jgi:uncharacterized membrane protein HdeD (DUF308 family)